MKPDFAKLNPIQSRRWLSSVETLLLAGVLVALMFAAAYQPSSAQSQMAAVWLDAPTKLAVGDITTLTVRIDNVVNLYACEFSLDFLPGLVEILDGDPAKNGVQITPGDCLAPQFIINETDNATGYITYTVTQLNPTLPFTGNCAMAYISLQALQEGAIPVVFDRLTLGDRYGNPIPTNSYGITLTIESLLDHHVFLPLAIYLADSPLPGPDLLLIQRRRNLPR